MDAEQVIKQELDGWFYSIVISSGIDAVPKVYARRVATDYIPYYSFEETEEGKRHAAKKKVMKREWTPAEDAMLMELRNGGGRWEPIASYMRRHKKSVVERYNQLCAELGQAPITLRPKGAASLSAEEKAKIVALRDAGKSWSQIGAEMNIGLYVARDYYHRFRQQIRNRSEAA